MEVVIEVPYDNKVKQVLGNGKKGELNVGAVLILPELLVHIGQNIEIDEPITNNPNVGGFGQRETEIVLQNPRRIYGLLSFFVVVLVSQVFLVLKKKQFEKVQLAEINF